MTEHDQAEARCVSGRRNRFTKTVSVELQIQGGQTDDSHRSAAKNSQTA